MASHSDALKLTERYREISPGVMQVTLTMDDAKAFTKPATRVSTWKYQPDWTIAEYSCIEKWIGWQAPTSRTQG